MGLYAKAIAAFCTSFIGVVGTIYADGKVETPEILIGIATVVLATSAVYAVPNLKARKRT